MDKPGGVDDKNKIWDSYGITNSTVMMLLVETEGKIVAIAPSAAEAKKYLLANLLSTSHALTYISLGRLDLRKHFSERFIKCFRVFDHWEMGGAVYYI